MSVSSSSEKSVLCPLAELGGRSQHRDSFSPTFSNLTNTSSDIRENKTDKPSYTTCYGSDDQEYTNSRSSPYLDQGYDTLVPAGGSFGWLSTCIDKFKKSTHTNHHHHSSYNKYDYFEYLPDHVLLNIFSFLSTSELCKASMVCSRWNNLSRKPSLWRTLTIHGEGINGDKAIKYILKRLYGDDKKCWNIKQVFIYEGARITNKGLTVLARGCPEITHFQAYLCENITDTAIVELTTRCPNLVHLNLQGCVLISCVSAMPGPEPARLQIQFLDLTDCISIQDTGLRLIVRNCPHLLYLYLRRCSKITDAGIKFVPSFCSGLRELSLSDCSQVTDFALYELAKLGASLRYLSVAKCNQVSDAGLKVIAKRCYKLRYLNVRGCEAVSDDSISVLARSCPRLRALDIGKCDVTDTGLKALAESCPNLKKLSLRNCDMITERGVQFISYYCRGLQQLNIQDCQISSDGYKAVKKYCKRCIIEHTNPGFF